VSVARIGGMAPAVGVFGLLRKYLFVKILVK
jgi:hypothetical protein